MVILNYGTFVVLATLPTEIPMKCFDHTKSSGIYTYILFQVYVPNPVLLSEIVSLRTRSWLLGTDFKVIGFTFVLRA